MGDRAERRWHLLLPQNTLSPLDTHCHAFDQVSQFLARPEETRLRNKLAVASGVSPPGPLLNVTISYQPMATLLLDGDLIDVVSATQGQLNPAVAGSEYTGGGEWQAVWDHQAAAWGQGNKELLQEDDDGNRLEPLVQWKKCEAYASNRTSTWSAQMCDFCTQIATMPTDIHPDQVPDEIVRLLAMLHCLTAFSSPVCVATERSAPSP